MNSKLQLMPKEVGIHPTSLPDVNGKYAIPTPGKTNNLI
tara:strand:+ start:402 stop:518 length:117 start_codon:yes stop_codon:yes gene_type:complete